MTPKHFTWVEYIIMSHLDPLWGLFGTHNGSNRTTFPPKHPSLGEKPPWSQSHPGNAQNTSKHSIGMSNTDVMHPDTFSATWVTENAQTSKNSNAAICESSEKCPWYPSDTQIAQKRVMVHDIGGTHTITVIYSVFDICRVSWGAQELFSQCGTFVGQMDPFLSPCGYL